MKKSDQWTYSVEYCGICDEPMEECECEFDDDKAAQQVCQGHKWQPSFDPRYLVCAVCGEPRAALGQKVAGNTYV